MDEWEAMMQSDTSGTASNMETSNYLDTLSDANSLFDAFQLAKKGSTWKESTQRCEINLLKNIYVVQKSLQNKSYRQRNPTEFILSERGKNRPIRSQDIIDRVVQRSLCDNILIPTLTPYLIYDNGASLKDKGVDFSKRRLVAHLEKFLRKHQTGYILLVDFSKFFDNIPHDLLLNEIKKRLKDSSIDWLLDDIVDTFSADVSYMSDEEFNNSENMVFDSMVHRKLRNAYGGPKGQKYLRRSLGIGSQVSQISGIFYPSFIDNFFKCVKGFKYYGRYMDDVYLVHENREVLKKALDEFIDQSNKLKMYVNLKKTVIVNLSEWFTFLKVRHRVLDNGKIERKICKDTFIREKRRLKKLNVMLQNNKIDFTSIYNSYLSWRGNIIRHPNNLKNLYYTDKVFIDLFYTSHKKRK